MIYKHLFAITNGTKQGCVIASVFFFLFFFAPFIFSSTMLYAFSDLDTYVQFGNCTTDRLFDHQRFKAKTLARLIINLRTVDDAVILSTSQEVLVRLKLSTKYLVMNSSIIRRPATFHFHC